MKKLAIAGAALALAAMPVVSTFAATSVTDKLTLTVSSTCQLGTVTPAAASGSMNEYTASGAPGETKDFAAVSVDSAAAAATNIQINCNDADGYKITPSFTALKINGLEGASDSQDIPYGGAATPADKTWTAFYSKNNGTVTNFADTTPIQGTPTMSDTYTFSYKVHIGTNQAAGTYVGTATYTLAAN